MSIRLTRLEAWALDIVSKVQAGKRVEDSRVELKREWPDQLKAARRIAGHANSCFGSNILWIIGLDEDIGVKGVNPEDLASWWPGICSHFDGITPVLTDIIISVGNQSLVCLLFETCRPPYVVKNPKFGLAGGGPVAWEVPWREGTSVRTATRNDLLRMLVPTITQPEVEILKGNGHLQNNIDPIRGCKTSDLKLYFNLSLYIYPHGDSSVVIPFHKCKCLLGEDTGNNILEGFNITMYLPSLVNIRKVHADTVTIERTSSELIVHGPGRCTVEVHMVMENEPFWLHNSGLKLRLILFVIDSELPVELDMSLIAEKTGKEEIRRWSIKPCY